MQLIGTSKQPATSRKRKPFSVTCLSGSCRLKMRRRRDWAKTGSSIAKGQVWSALALGEKKQRQLGLRLERQHGHRSRVSIVGVLVENDWAAQLRALLSEGKRLLDQMDG
ncbi:hypothetical protein BN1723_008572 [Verticillium longisporum]|uniref:Uncharacterized protein n=1 Tax=Verticillium longisporum TaxID=100787 RepID=A0A0G4KHZ3_VERLO|nr:hypothetical protein BN1723_008572 [Verticillium longisporum]